MKIKRKLKKIQMFILVIVMLSSYFIIIPKKVFAKESKYYYYSKNSSISAVGNELKGKYQGAPGKYDRRRGSISSSSSSRFSFCFL